MYVIFTDIGVVPEGSVWGGSPSWQSQTGRVSTRLGVVESTPSGIP